MFKTLALEKARVHKFCNTQMYSPKSLWEINFIWSNPCHEEYITSNFFFAKTVFHWSNLQKLQCRDIPRVQHPTLNVTVFYTFRLLCIHWITKEVHSIDRKFALFGNPVLLIAVIFFFFLEEVCSSSTYLTLHVEITAAQSHYLHTSNSGRKATHHQYWHKPGLLGSHPNTA